MHKYRITPRPTIEAEKIASDLILHVDDPKTSVPVTAGTIAGLLAGLDQLAVERAKTAELEEALKRSAAVLLYYRDGGSDRGYARAACVQISGTLGVPDVPALMKKPGSLLDLQGWLKRADQQPVPIEAMRIGKCVCGPDGCADSECPGRCGGAA